MGRRKGEREGRKKGEERKSEACVAGEKRGRKEMVTAVAEIEEKRKKGKEEKRKGKKGEGAMCEAK
jgi:hypothetical protein